MKIEEMIGWSKLVFPKKIQYFEYILDIRNVWDYKGIYSKIWLNSERESENNAPSVSTATGVLQIILTFCLSSVLPDWENVYTYTFVTRSYTVFQLISVG